MCEKYYKLLGCETSMYFTFVVDTSSSVCHGTSYNAEGNCDNFITLKEFIKNVVKEGGTENLQTALINFSTHAQVTITFYFSIIIPQETLFNTNNETGLLDVS